MAEIDGVQLHPILEDINAVQDAVYYLGLTEALEHGHIGEGSIRGAFIPWDEAESDYPVSRLDLLDIEKGTQTTIAFAPPIGVENPMYMWETDTVDPSVSNIIPIIARVLLKPIAGLRLVDAGGASHMSKSILFNFTNDAAIMAYDEDLDIMPSVGEYDDKNYRSARRILATHTPLPAMLEFVAARN